MHKQQGAISEPQRIKSINELIKPRNKVQSVRRAKRIPTPSIKIRQTQSAQRYRLSPKLKVQPKHQAKGMSLGCFL